MKNTAARCRPGTPVLTLASVLFSDSRREVLKKDLIPVLEKSLSRRMLRPLLFLPVCSLMLSAQPALATTDAMSVRDCWAIGEMHSHFLEVMRHTFETMLDTNRAIAVLEIEFDHPFGHGGLPFSEQWQQLKSATSAVEALDNNVVQEGFRALRRACPMIFD